MDQDNFKIYWDEKNNLARSEFKTSALKAEEAIRLKAQSIEMLNQHKNCDWLIDIRKATDYPSPEVRIALTELARSTQSGKIAFLVVSEIMKKAAYFIMSLIGKEKEVKFFITEEEALNWLK